MKLTTALGLMLASITIVACSSESSGAENDGADPGATGTASAATSCSDVCANITERCGSTPATCSSTCASLAEATRKCVAAAGSCAAIDGCGTAPATSAGDGSGTGAGTGTGTATTDPCKVCGSSQFCVTASSVSSELGCIDPPSTCNGSSDVCSCLLAKGTGPCSKGGKTCTEGLANRLSCQ